ncbi:HIT family protein [Ideonella sp. BN130291]|uniref:HIT family protein n=1 Tax=Ideonella sp. BN130291 TaxID=3112940 RepID=UPI002E2661FD|nr:HIT family protein [Ideonella sp. BN130291]
MSKGCHLCAEPGGEPVWADGLLRVVRVEDTPDFPAFYRVIWTEHVAELSDLGPDDLRHCMDAVVCVERTMRQHLAPTKMNVATLGNMVAHLHWHVIARFDWDTHFPYPIWATAQRAADTVLMQRLRASLADLDRAVAAALADK